MHRRSQARGSRQRRPSRRGWCPRRCRSHCRARQTVLVWICGSCGSCWPWTWTPRASPPATASRIGPPFQRLSAAALRAWGRRHAAAGAATAARTSRFRPGRTPDRKLLRMAAPPTNSGQWSRQEMTQTAWVLGKKNLPQNQRHQENFFPWNIIVINSPILAKIFWRHDIITIEVYCASKRASLETSPKKPHV